MKYSQVTIKGLTRIQANTLALLAENGDIGELINERIKSFEIEEDSEKADEFQLIDDTMASMDFDESDGDVEHEADFS